jgi:PPM family protein phosphatase
MALFNPLESSTVTHPGLKRDNNEDCYLSAPQAGLWLVADGMGGHEAGEVASAIVRDTIENLTHEAKHFSINAAIQAAHGAILAAAEQGIGATGMGSTVVALVSHKKNYQIAWVGDSRAYLWTPSLTGGVLTRLTVDHSYVQMLFSSGALTAEEVESHPDKNIITQCLGMQELALVNVDMAQGVWQKDQWIILCSDGLTDELSDEKISQILADNNDCKIATKKLLKETLNSGGRDNVTIQIVESPIRESDNFATQLLDFVPVISRSRKVDVIIFMIAVFSIVALIIEPLL